MPERDPIDFWFDFGSPYGYFMAEKIEAVATRHDRTVRWHPILLFAVLRTLALPAPLENAVKRDYMRLDFERSARHLDVEFTLPDGFPAPTQNVARAFYLLDQLDPPTAVRFARRAMRAYFREGAPVGEAAVAARWLAEAAPSLGDAASCETLLQGSEARTLLADAVNQAVRQRVFGSPFLVVDGEPFFGVDRLPQIEALLAGVLAASLHPPPSKV